MNFLSVLFDNLRKGPSTDPFPFGETQTPKNYRGKVEYDASKCVGCKMCEHVCSGGAIRFGEDDEGIHFVIWHNTCISCGLCAHYCPTKAITLSDNWHLAHPQSEKFEKVDHGVVPYRSCTGCGQRFLAAAPALMNRAFAGTSPQTEELAALCPDCRRAASLRRGQY